ncbi:MAG: hypothetical protein HY695_26765 [Deltaproteobacteria bacterium]|nr:hypothetical protein [Deltaproteobacteria bacterium]
MKQKIQPNILIALLVLLSTAACAPTARVVVGGKPLEAQQAVGLQRVLVLAVSFPGIPTGVPLRQVRGRALDRVADYYAKASYGKVKIAGEVKGWYQLPRPLEEYKVSPYNINVDPARVKKLVEDAFSAAEKDVNFSQYNHVIVVVGVETRPGVGYGMIAYCANPGMLRAGLMRRDGARMEEITTRSGQRYDRGIVVVAQNALVGHIVHDLAHAMGGAVAGKRPIPDLYDTVLQGKVGPLTHESYRKFAVFMGPWDVMSQHFVKGEQSVPGMSSFTRLRMGWIEPNQVVEVSPGQSRAVTLAPLGGGQGTLAVRIPGPWGTYYLLENRQILPADPLLPSQGLLVLHIDESKHDGDGIVRVESANPQVPEFGAATYGVSTGQASSASLQWDAAIEALWQEQNNLTILVTDPSHAPEIRATAKRLREIDNRLKGMPGSSGRSKARADLAAAKELLMQMKVSEARARLENTPWP